MCGKTLDGGGTIPEGVGKHLKRDGQTHKMGGNTFKRVGTHLGGGKQ